MALASLVVAVVALVVSGASWQYARNRPIAAAAKTADAATPDTSSMPMVVGMKLAVAQSVLLSAIADARIEVQEETNGNAPPGIVIRQSPAAGTAVPTSSTIQLAIASL